MKTKPENILPGVFSDDSSKLSPLDAGRLLLEEKKTPLNSLDLMQYESLLCESLFKVLPFSAHSLYFPMNGGRNHPEPEYLPDEEKLLLPLYWENGGQLGLFVARGLVVPPEMGSGARGKKKLENRLKRLLPLLPEYARLCLDNISLCKNSQHDQVSGLYNRAYLLDRLGAALVYLRENLRVSAGFGERAAGMLQADELGEAGGAAAASAASTAAASAERSLWSARQFGLMVIRLNGLAAQVREHGYLRAEALVEALARKLEDLLSGRADEQYSGRLGELYSSLHLSLGRVLAARSGDYEFSLLLPDLGAGACRALGRFLALGLGPVGLKNELTGRRFSVRPSIGFAVAPKDLDGMERRHPAEQARIILRRARLASAMVFENLRQYAHLYGKQILAGADEELSPVLGYGSILSEGGRVVQVFPLSRMLVSLGRGSGARVGQTFTLWGYASGGDHSSSNSSPPRRYKGEVRLVGVEQSVSTAELLYCDDPRLMPHEGDQLFLNRLDSRPAEVFSVDREEAGRLLSYTDFLPLWSLKREQYDGFYLILSRFNLKSQVGSGQSPANVRNKSEVVFGGGQADFPGAFAPGLEPDPEDGDLPDGCWDASTGQDWEARMAQAFRLCSDILGAAAVFGRLALNSFIIFVPGAPLNSGAQPIPSLGDIQEKLSVLGGSLEEKIDIESAFGIARYPFLNFSKADTLDNAHKALEYSLLLPAPRIGPLDSLALNISADRLFSLGDLLGAISEYKQALLCDENNVLARNSLGVALAGLGRGAEARRHFETALEKEPDNISALYNLAQLCQTQGEQGRALDLYLNCLSLDPDNVYAMQRLGQLAEQRGDLEGARSLYKQAASLPGGEALTCRSLARLAIREKHLEEAREELHKALLINPADAVSLQLLARLYLDAGENPAVAESLARQSAALRPDLKSAWLELARALEAGGKPEAAREAVIRAGEL